MTSHFDCICLSLSRSLIRSFADAYINSIINMKCIIIHSFFGCILGPLFVLRSPNFFNLQPFLTLHVPLLSINPMSLFIYFTLFKKPNLQGEVREWIVGYFLTSNLFTSRRLFIISDNHEAFVPI